MAARTDTFERLAPQAARRPRGGCENEAGATPVARGRGEATLEDVVLDAWEGLAASGSAPCPVCAGGELRPHRPCDGCGSLLL